MQPTLIDRLKLSIQKNAQTQYSSVIPLAQDVQTGKISPALPDMVRGPLGSLLNVLSAFEKPGEATEQIVPDMLNVVLAGRVGGKGANVVSASTHQAKRLSGDEFYQLLAGLRLLNYDPNSKEGFKLYFDAIRQIAPKALPKGINMPIEPKERKGINMRIEPLERRISRMERK